MNKLHFWGIGVLSASLLMLEILATRVSKIIFGYDFQFIILSLAIAGIGIGGILTYGIFSFEKGKQKLSNRLGGVVFLYVSILILPFLIASNKALLGLFLTKILFFLSLFFAYILCGIVISFLFTIHKKQISKLYFFDMVGAALGSLLVVFLLDAWGNLIATLGVFFMAFVSVIFFIKQRHFKFLVGGVGIVTLSVLFFVNQSGFSIKCEQSIWSDITSKTKNRSLFTVNSNSYSQVESYKNLKLSEIRHPILIDCTGLTFAVPLLENMQNHRIELLSSFIPYAFKNFDSALILGAGGGMNVAQAYLGGVTQITAVEINPLMEETEAQLVSRDRSVYAKPNVSLMIQEGRNFLENTNQKYDHINIAFLKKYGGAGIKEFMFLENYLFTTEAFESYIDHLNPEGILFLQDHNYTLSRYFPTFLSVLKKIGFNPDESLLVVPGSKISYIFFKKGVFSAKEKAVLELEIKTRWGSSKSLGAEDLRQAYASPILTDNRPYYWGIKPFGFFEIPEKDGRFATKNDLFILLIGAGCIYLFILILPFFLKEKKPLLFKHSLYFSFVAFGFITLELMFVQLFSLWFGNPVHTLALILPTVLFFSGIGSFLTRNILAEKVVKQIKINYIFLFLALLGLFLVFLYKASWGMQLPLFFKILIVLILVSIPSVFMGTFFPLGLKLVEKYSSKQIPYMWGINGLATVLGGIGSILIALYLGFLFALLIGVIFIYWHCFF